MKNYTVTLLSMTILYYLILSDLYEVGLRKVTLCFSSLPHAWKCLIGFQALTFILFNVRFCCISLKSVVFTVADQFDPFGTCVQVFLW